VYKNEITLSSGTPNFPLKPCWVGKLSAAKFRFLNVPNVEGMTIRVVVGPMSDSGSAYTVDGTVANGIGSVYVGGWLFTMAYTTTYEVILFEPAEVEGDDPIAYWVGKGALCVMDATTAALTPEQPPIIPPETYVRSAATGLYYLVSAAENDLGEITLEVAEEGVEDV